MHGSIDFTVSQNGKLEPMKFSNKPDADKFEDKCISEGILYQRHEIINNSILANAEINSQKLFTTK